jgi:hypothetical protein
VFFTFGIGTTIGHNTKKYTHHTEYHTTLIPNRAHTATQTIQDTLHKMNTTQKGTNDISLIAMLSF